jgi:hypothetical protein
MFNDYVDKFARQPFAYSDLNNSDPGNLGSDCTYSSDSATTEEVSVYMSEHEEHRCSSTDDETFDHNDSTD